jgi:molybdate/tungstate transport system substrate-binding protein
MVSQRPIFSLLLIFLITILCPACRPASPVEKTPLVVFCAGSLILPFAALEQAFESQHPEVDVLNECHGSIQVIRHVTELHESIDVVATADYALIPMLMYAVEDPDSGLPYASWSIRFATNHLGLAYSPHSDFADEINANNWYAVVTRPGVSLGIADPRFDASGYRALMALKLAENFYQQPAIFDSLIQGQFTTPINVFQAGSLALITVPEIVETVPEAHILMRGASIQLIALLESGDLDYAFEYESVIRQHELEWVALPDAINLGSSQFNEQYQQVQVNLNFQRFTSVQPFFRGEQIGYGITIPSNAPHPELAEQFIAFLLGPEGQQIMADYYQPLLDPLTCDFPDLVPESLQAYCHPDG